MSRRYLTIILKLFSLGFVMAAGVCWAGSGVDARPKYSDEQTLVGGAIWSQIIIPIGLMVSLSVDNTLSDTVHAFYLILGVVLLIATGLLLVIYEWRRTRRRRRARRASSIVIGELHFNTRTKYDKVYLAIGLLCLAAGVVMFADFLIIMLMQK